MYATPGRFGGGGAATTWLVGSAEDVATALENYRELGINTSFCPTPRTGRRSPASVTNCFPS
ncbi:hypothetical protein ACIPSA_18475 [Streptomyces sp. NPDC086549]|uniref:hypothetical protein n=1 Tax=Streptomyces sp. NPDC086549 TaxID=3365752 RepID=UPI00381E92CC